MILSEWQVHHYALFARNGVTAAAVAEMQHVQAVLPPAAKAEMKKLGGLAVDLELLDRGFVIGFPRTHLPNDRTCAVPVSCTKTFGTRDGNSAEISAETAT